MAALAFTLTTLPCGAGPGASWVSTWVPLSLPIPQKERTFSFCGTIEYMAPEIIRSKAGHGKVDLGVGRVVGCSGR